MPHGKAMHRELKLLTEAGFSPAEALRAAPGKSAGLFHLKDRGVLEAGRRADLLLVRGEPTRDMDASRDILGVWLEGALLESGSAA